MYEARRRSTEMGLGERELVVTRQQLDELTDAMFVLSEALDDARRAARGVSNLEEANELLGGVFEAAEAALPAAR